MIWRLSYNHMKINFRRDHFFPQWLRELLNSVQFVYFSLLHIRNSLCCVSLGIVQLTLRSLFIHKLLGHLLYQQHFWILDKESLTISVQTILSPQIQLTITLDNCIYCALINKLRTIRFKIMGHMKKVKTTWKCSKKVLVKSLKRQKLFKVIQIMLHIKLHSRERRTK